MFVNKAIIGGIIAAIVIGIAVVAMSTGNLTSETVSEPSVPSETIEEPVSTEPIDEPAPSEPKSITIQLEENVGIKGKP